MAKIQIQLVAEAGVIKGTRMAYHANMSNRAYRLRTKAQAQLVILRGTYSLLKVNKERAKKVLDKLKAKIEKYTKSHIYHKAMVAKIAKAK